MSTALRARTLLARHGPTLGLLMAATAGAAVVNLRDVLDRWSTVVPTVLDNRFQSWTIHWVQGALMGEHGLYAAPIFAPAADTLTYSDHLIGVAVVLLPLRWAGLSPAAVFNTGLVLGLVVDAAGGYALGQVVTRRRVGGVVAGAVYALGPLPWLSTTHIHLVWRPGLPIAVALVWVLAERRADAGAHRTLPGRRVLLASLAAVVAWQALVSFILALFVLVVVAVAILVRARSLGRGSPAVVGAVALGALLAAPSYVPYLGTQDRLPGFGWELDEVRTLRANPAIVEEAGSVWGRALGRPLFGNDGYHAFPGLIVVVLVALGVGATLVAHARRRRGGRAEVPARAGLLGLGISVIAGALAAGPGDAGWGDWTPYALAFRFVPGFSAARGSGRFALAALTGASVLAAVAVTALLGRWERMAPGSHRRGRLRVAVVAALVLTALAVEGLNEGREVTPASSRPLDHRLAAIDEEGGVAYLPIAYGGPADFSTQEDIVLRSTTHDRRIVNGYAGFYPPSAFALAARLEALPSEDALDCLTVHDIRFVVVTDRVDLTSWAVLVDPDAADPLELVAEADGEVLYRVPDRSVPRGTCALPGVDDG